MIDSYTATSIIIGFLIIFGIVLPILDRIPKVRDVVSLRWTLVVIYSAMAIGVILNFSHLDSSVRLSVIIGGTVLSAIYLVVRSLENAALHKWHLPKTHASVKKGDVTAELSVIPNVTTSEHQENKQEDNSTH